MYNFSYYFILKNNQLYQGTQNREKQNKKMLSSLLLTRAKSAQNFGFKSKFYVFKTKIQKCLLISHKNFQKSSEIVRKCLK